MLNCYAMKIPQKAMEKGVIKIKNQKILENASITDEELKNGSSWYTSFKKNYSKKKIKIKKEVFYQSKFSFLIQF